jgi:hypothetical protein
MRAGDYHMRTGRPITALVRVAIDLPANSEVSEPGDSASSPLAPRHRCCESSLPICTQAISEGQGGRAESRTLGTAHLARLRQGQPGSIPSYSGLVSVVTGSRRKTI